MFRLCWGRCVPIAIADVEEIKFVVTTVEFLNSRLAKGRLALCCTNTVKQFIAMMVICMLFPLLSIFSAIRGVAIAPTGD